MARSVGVAASEVRTGVASRRRERLALLRFHLLTSGQRICLSNNSLSRSSIATDAYDLHHLTFIKNRMLKYILGASLLFASTVASAAIPVPCATYKTDNDFRARAVLEEAITNRGTYWVYNLADNTVQKWTIKASSGGGGGGPVPTSVPSYLRGVAPLSDRQTKGTVEPAVVSEVDAGHKVYIEGGFSLRPIYNVPVSMLNMSVTNNQSAYNIFRTKI